MTGQYLGLPGLHRIQPGHCAFKPCLHMVAAENCASVMKKCVECRSVIEGALYVCCGGKQAKIRRKVVNMNQ